MARNLLSRGRRAPEHKCLPVTEELREIPACAGFADVKVNFQKLQLGWFRFASTGMLGYCSAALAQS